MLARGDFASVVYLIPAMPPSSVQSLLECYIRAKDQNQPELIFDCFAADAEVTFSIATDAIDFPHRVIGASAIARTLVADFGERFDRCRTYYVCIAPEANGEGICTMPWVVAMRQKDNEALRLGKGTYKWRIGSVPGEVDRIIGLHIAIERMDLIDDPGTVKLQTLQESLTYPWLPPTALAECMELFVANHPDPVAVAFWHPFRH
ncbi:hypothetical protein AWB67_07255 [Caballeronia terrestris]|uniref:SnoaL-like domain-containing protein n=1 Tax=Caballeronia terrestris TaxID=1226301 RepID=A0A158KZV1_9BURK|nr:hypothetical protein [Caballeronia terrestris]SAL86678.1 hypothetical protein AWB67_07255 [Caballeronia terrestris]